MEDSDFDELIGFLYGSLVQPAGFMKFLEILSNRLNLNSAAILIANNFVSSAELVWEHCADADEKNEYRRYYQEKEVVNYLQSIHKDKLLVVNNLQDRLNKKAHIYNISAIVLIKDDRWTSHLYFRRHKALGVLSVKEEKLVQRLSPHIQSVLHLYRLKLDRDKQLFLSDLLFNKIMLPVILLDEVGLVSHCNQQAELFLVNFDMLQQSNRQLSCLNAKKNLQLREFVQACQEESVSHLLPLDIDKKTQVILTFEPLLHRENNDKAGVAIFIYHLNQITVNQKMLSKLYNLSVKEALICSGLIAGQSLSEIAKETYLSYETVRTYIKYIMKKTRTNRQSELVVKLLASPACDFVNRESF